VDLAVVGLVAGSGWASGVNLYAVVALLGIYGRLGLGEVPAGLLRTDTIVIASVLFAIEFVADKIPVFDSIWDTVHTVIRPVGAAVLGAILVGDAETWQQGLAAFGAGGLAASSHVAKATTRLAVNTSPEPVSNSLVSLAEDGLVAAVVWFAFTNPVLTIAIVLVLVIAGTALTVAMFSAARGALRRRRERRAARAAGAS
jgi:hypothetical protein